MHQQPPAAPSPVRKFYEGRNVFVTGATGFMGKVLVEKLLRSTDAAAIYLLVRPKKGKDVQGRLDEIIADSVFDRLRAEKQFKHRLVPVKGDCALPNLGLDPCDENMLVESTHVIFHAAATVRFDENLKLAFKINVSATRDVLELAKRMKNLKALVHVSTAYANCHLAKIEERFYDYPVGHGDVEKLLEKASEENVQEATPRILNLWPNTYTFTKAMAEDLISSNCSGLPLGIFRPAIVVSTYSEPISGWIDNMYGPTGVVAGAASGVLRTLLCDPDIVANIVPVDKSVAALIACAWDVSKRNTKMTKEDVPIYNYVSSVENPITWDEFLTINVIHGEKYPLMKSIWCICFSITNNVFVHNLHKLLYHYLAGFALDVLLLCTGQKLRFLSMYKKIHKFSDVIQYFCVHHWDFTNDNVQRLWEELEDSDKRVFPFSMKTVLWLQFFKNYIKGLRLHLFKDPLDTLPTARARTRRFKILHVLAKFALCFVLMYALLCRMSSACDSEKSLTFQLV